MPTNVIMPALELAQETGKLLRWIKASGDTVRKGEPIAEIETDKVTVEIEAPASGVLRDVTAQEGDVVPVGHTIAIIAAAGEAVPPRPSGAGPDGRVKASPLAKRIARDSGLDLQRVTLGAREILHQIPRGLQRVVVVKQAHPQCRQRAKRPGMRAPSRIAARSCSIPE